jgi:two-component system NarL family response regulator
VRQYILGIRSDPHSTRPDSVGVSPTDFWGALEEYLALMRARYDLDIGLSTPAELRESTLLSPKVEVQVLRIIQEGITNVHKHAQASRVDLVLTRQGDWLHVQLEDDGRGFDVDALPATAPHFGLQIMRERAEGTNGHFEVAAAPGHGTRLEIRVPCILEPDSPTGEPRYPWRVLLVDDHSLFLAGLQNMLRPHGIQIVGIGHNGIEAESQAAELQPELILMDIHMPERDGLEATRRIKQRFPQIKVVMLTVAAEDDLLLQALNYGASGYLLKNLPVTQFLSLLADVMAGKTIIAPALANRVLTTLAQGDDATLTGSPAVAVLTPRQREVLYCIGQGMSNRQIAAELSITENTVKYHTGRIMRRLGLQTRYELIRYQFDLED